MYYDFDISEDLRRAIYKVRHTVPLSKGLIEDLFKYGVLRKSQLEHGEYYWGDCRNANQAKWNAEKNEFIYWRNKFGYTFTENIRHPEDDDGYDLFIPFQKIEKKENIKVIEESTYL